MKTMLLILVFFTGFGNGHDNLDLEVVRQNYRTAVSNKMLCHSMIESLKTNDDKNVCLAYLGAYQTVWANHVLSPITKLSTFNEGKKNIELAIKKDPANLELRFIRLSVQKNAPSFLGYNKQKSEDEIFLRKNKKKIQSSVLLNMVNNLLND